jgi:hypothetical protein
MAEFGTDKAAEAPFVSNGHRRPTDLVKSLVAETIDPAGNRVKGLLVIRFSSQHLGLDLFVSRPEVSFVPCWRYPRSIRRKGLRS